MKAVVVASGDLVPGDLRHLDGAGLVVAADGGAIALDAAGCRIDRLVGDLDSLDPAFVDRLVGGGTVVARHPIDKDESDTELALEATIAAGADAIVLIGGLGGERLDHELANVMLLADPAIGRRTRAVRGATTIRAIAAGGHLVLDAGVGDLVTLLPIGGDAEGVTTAGLRWALDGATLRLGRSRGLSNEIVAARASVRLGHGTLLVVETRKADGGAQ